MRKTILLPIACLMLAACGAKTISVDVAVDHGFKKQSQQFYQMVGAVDGWSGTWSGEVVELYQFENASAIQSDAFKSMVVPGNISGWVELCTHKNMLMLSKGSDACRKLKSI
ncbi:hypothetical protein [Alkalimonas mucilaginosa]|uniref:Lipoprotein n=1 Tax=Alkalimonas mucilaginosa TaxID=3057676 RepID=A0ABU7JDW2_9GAMM|nr:hypothetical protein [Alkalimonas sp. MEB004]MEE2023601.1 hypothetical protein [Alkalimonas sp. MEB004]